MVWSPTVTDVCKGVGVRMIGFGVLSRVEVRVFLESCNGREN